MEILKVKYDNFFSAYYTFTDAIKEQADIRKLTDKCSTTEAGVIKHFELVYETAWKFLKEYLRIIHGVDVGSPKGVFRACRVAKVLPDNLVGELLVLADIRNATAHIYDRILAHDVFESVEQHKGTFEQVLKTFEREFN